MSYLDEYYKALEEERKKREQAAEMVKAEAEKRSASLGSDDIAPDNRKWFQKGAFEDGYQFGDVTKTILGIEEKKKLNTFTAPETDYSLEELKQKRDYLAGRTWNTAEQSADLLKYTKMYNQMALYQYSETLSKTKMDGQNHTVLEEIEILANMKNGKEKDKRKDAVLKKMEELGMDTSFYVDFAGDGEFSWSAFGKWAKNAAMAGLASVNKGLLDTADVILGAPMKALGWEDNPFSKGAEYFGTVYDTYKYNANIYANELGGGAWNFGSEAIEGTTGALPHALLMFMTGGASTTATTSSITTQSAMQTGNWLTKAGLTVESMMKNPQYWMSFSRTLGSDYKEAKELGVSDAAATVGAILKSTVNAGIEIGFDGGSGIQGLDDALKNGGIPFYEWVESTLEEGGEEMLQKFVGEAIDKVGYGSDKEILNPIEYAKEGALGVISGAALGGGQTVVQSGVNAYNEHQQNKLTDVEQAVVDKVYKDLISEAEKEGKITEREKSKIYDAVLERMDKGYIDTETIEGVLGDRSAYDNLVKESEEFDKLYNTPGGQLSKAQQDKLEEKNKKSPYKALLEAEKGKLSQGVQDMVKGSRLAESYAERGRRGQAFQADVSRHDAKQRATVQAAIDSGVLNNTNRSHELVDFVAKLAADKGLTFNFADNAKLKETGFALEDVTVNGFVSGSGVTVNVQSAKALNSVVGHEITHVLEGTELYGALQKAVTEYARAKGEYQSRYDSLAKLYAGIEGANVEAELVADLVGDYLFADKAFVQKLSTEHRNVFQKIFDEVKYLCKVVTAGSKEAKKLLEVKKIFEEVYRQDAKNPTGDGGVRYSISEIVDASGNNYGVGVHLDSTLLDNLTPEERVGMVKEYVKELGGEAFTAYDPSGNAVDITIASSNARFRNQSGKKVPVNKDLTTKRINNEVKQEAIALVDELITTAEYDTSSTARYPHGWLDNNGQNDWEYWTTYIQDKNNTIWEATLNVANSADGKKILYDISPIKKVGQSVKSDTIPTDNSVPQGAPTVNTQNSLSEIGQADNIAPLPWQIKSQDVALENFAPIREDVVTGQNAASEGELVSEGKVLAENAGIRSQLRNNQEKLDAMQLVAEIQVPAGYAQLDIAGKKNWVAEKLRPTGYKVERKGFGVIDFAKKRLKSAFNYFDKNSVEEVAFEAIPYVLENGIEVANRSDHKDRNYGTVTIAAPITINGKRGNMAVVVKRTSGNYYKVHRILTPDGSVFHLPEMTNEAESTPAGESPKIGSLATPKDSASTVSIPEQETVVNPDDSTGAAPSGFDPVSHLQYEYGSLPEGENAVREDSLPKSTNGEDRVSLTARTAKGAEATPDELVDLLDKETVGGRFSYIPIKNSDTVRKAYDEIVKKGWEAARGEWEAKVRRGEVSAELTATGALLLNNAAKAGDRKVWLSVLHDYQIMGTNAGQAVQALRILKTLSPDDSLYMIERSVEQMVEDMKLGTEIVIDENLKQQYLDAKTDSDKDAALDALAEDVARQIPSTAADKWTALRYLNMLGNFRTQGRNILGNTGMAVVSKVKNGIAAALEGIVYHISGGKFHRTKSLFVSKEQLNAARNDFANVESVALNGGKFNDPMAKSIQFQQKVQDARKIFKFAPMEKYRRATNLAMNQGDLVFSKAAYGRALAGYLKAQGIKETDYSKIDPQVLDEARAYAIQQAQEQTFRDNNWLSDWVSKAGRRNDTPKVGKLISEGVMPFRKTPANILIRAEEYSPLGIVNATVKSVQAAKGKATGADVVNSWAKALTGTGLFALGMLLNSSGALSGGPDEDDDKEWFEDQYGWQNYALHFGDVNLTIDFLSPEAMPLLMGAQMMEMMNDGGIELKEIESALLSLADPMIEMSMLQGVNDTLENIRYAESNMGQFLVNACLSYLTQGLTNSFLGQVERSFETQRMSTYVDKDSDLPDWLQKALGKASAKTPVWDYNQIPYINAWGEEEENNPLFAALENMLSPSYIEHGKTDAVYEELNRLNDAQSDINVYPQTPDKTLTFEGANGVKHKDYNLSQDEYVQLAKLQGQTQKKLVEEIISSEVYGELSDMEKAKAIQLAYQYAREYSRMEVLNADGFSSKWMATAENVMEAIISHTSVERTFAYDYPGKYALAQAVGGYDSYMGYRDALEDIKADYDENGKVITDSKKQKVVDYINGLDAEYGEKIILYVSEYSNKESRAAYGAEIVDYLGSREDISYEDMVSILTELGFTVRDGWVTLD